MTSLPAPTWKSFLRYVLPSLGAMVLVSSYTVIDGIFVAKGVSDLAFSLSVQQKFFVNHMTSS